MGLFNFSIGSLFRKTFGASGYFNMFTPSASFASLDSVEQKLNIVLSNPALLKVICLQCDLFSLGKIYVYKDGKEVKDDPFLNLISSPNPFDQQNQFLWSFMFWNMIGNSYVYIDSSIVEKPNNKIYILESRKIEFPSSMDDMSDKLLFSTSSVNRLNDTIVTYRYNDGSDFKFKYGNLIHVPDLSGHIGSRFIGPSRINALYKIIANSEEALKSQNINLKFAGKYMVAGKTDPTNVTQLPMANDEKEDIEAKMNGDKQVHAVKSMIDIKRFVEDMGSLQLPEQYLGLYFLIGNMYNIPRDVLEAYVSSTYENQEKARAAHVSYCLQPKGDILMGSFTRFFNYKEQGKEMVIDWEHLPFMQAFAKDRAETKRIDSFTLLNLQKAGVPLAQINEFMDTNFSDLNPPVQNGNEQQQQNQDGSNQTGLGNAQS